MNSRHLLIIPALALYVGCGGGGAESDDAPPDTARPASPEAAPSAAPTGDINQELADLGQTLFQSKGCVGCHTIGSGRLTGPDLRGVVERREFNWIVAMMTNPDSMVKQDPVARQLLAEYMTPMLNMGVTMEDAKALYEYLRRDGQ